MMTLTDFYLAEAEVDAEHLPSDTPALPPLTDDEAERLVDSYCSHLDRIARLGANHKARVAEEQAKADRILALHGARLREYYDRRVTGKSKTVRLATGVLQTSLTPRRVVVTSPDALLAYARENAPGAIREVADAGALVSLTGGVPTDPATGEVLDSLPPGVEVAGGEERFRVKSATRTIGGSDA